jgi:glycosyl transferase, family 25
MLKIRTYVLNLKSRTDRRWRMERLMPDCLAPEFTSDWDIETDWKRMDWKSSSELKLFQWKIRSDNSWWNRPLKKGEVACAIAHLNAWRAALASDDSKYVFLEDDVSFGPAFCKRLSSSLTELESVGPPWDLLYLGREPLGEDAVVARGIVRPGYSFGAYAYMLTKEGIQKLLSAKYERDLIPVDEFLPAMYCDHPRADVRHRFPKGISAYALEPPVVPEVDEKILGSDTESSSFIVDET